MSSIKIFEKNLAKKTGQKSVKLKSFEGEMLYKYFVGWISQNSAQKLRFKEVLKYEDQYAFKFNQRRKYLQINLSSQDSFIFFTENDLLPFRSDNKLNIINAHLKNSELEKIEILNNDRIFDLTFSRIDIYNQKIEYRIVLEFIPRYQNLILLKCVGSNSEEDEIIDCLRKVSFSENRQRQVLPGISYTPPQSNYQNASESIDFPISILNGKIIENSSEKDSFKNINELFEHLFYEIILKKRIAESRQNETAVLNKKIAKKQHKISKLMRELASAKKEQKWKQYAELLKADFSQINTGQKSIILTNYYQADFPQIEIPLQTDKNAQQNIEYYFKKYKKARTGKKRIAEQIKKTENEIEKLNEKIDSLADRDFFLKEENKKITKTNSSPFKSLKVSDDWAIYIGRNGSENDRLTTRFAKPSDWWFHTRIFRGTHIILRNFRKKELPETLKFLCCGLAAYFSKAGKSSNVPVDYTQIRYVRKPKGSPVGFVTYTNQKTLYIDPLSMREAAGKIRKGLDL